MTLLSLSLAYVGFVGLSLAMERHHEQVFGTRRIPPMRGRAFRCAGWILLVLSLLPPVAGSGWGFGIVLWTGLLTVAAVLLLLLLAIAPRVAAAIAILPLPLGLLLAVQAS